MPLKYFKHPFYKFPGFRLFRGIGFSFTILLGSFINLPAQGEPGLAQIRQELAGPVEILLKNGSRQTGRVTKWNGETLKLSVSLGQGEAEMTFERSDIQSIHFPGQKYLATLLEWMAEPSKREDTIALFRLYYQQKGPYFDLLDPSELRLFIRYAQFALENEPPTAAIAMVNALRPHLHDPRLIKELDDAVLLGFYLSGMHEEAETQAKDWVKAADPYGDSALGWRVLAEIFFAAERYEDAFWAALNPVAFAGDLPMEHLNVCYAYATLAAEKMRLRDEASRLAREMRDRGLPWPENNPSLKGLAPEAYLTEEPEPTELESSAPSAPTGEPDPPTDDAPPVQTPSPIDAEQTLPTRINF